MSTDLEHEEPTPETVATVAEEAVDITELLEFKREHVHGNMTPCPVCNLLVPISARRCQHCESNIEANNALVRETLRHIEEISAQLDADGRALDRAWRSLANRVRRVFGGKTKIEGVVNECDSSRALTGVTPGDPITVVSVAGSWVLVRTADGREGWVYAVPRD